MLSKKELDEIKEHLDRAQNPIFYYDNDCDGLCSFLLFRKYLGRGKGVAVRSFPDLNASYARKARELNSDYVFILDKPLISKDFFEAINEIGLPVVWIDHHDIDYSDFQKSFSNLFVYNPLKGVEGEKSNEPVTYWSFKITNRKEDLWIAVMGCIADHYLPDFSDEFRNRYSEFWGDVSVPFDAYFKTEIGVIAKAINFGLKDSTTHIIQLQNYLISCNGPSDVFLETPGNYTFRKKYKDIKRKYDELLERAKKIVFDKFIFFVYSGDLSISSDLANELSYNHPNKYVIVAYRKEGICNLSLRGKNVKDILDRVLKRFENGSGGGHEDAVGARIKNDDLMRFKEEFLKEISK